MIWVLMIFLAMPNGEQRLIGWGEYSNKMACESAGSHLTLPKKDQWHCVMETI